MPQQRSCVLQLRPDATKKIKRIHNWGEFEVLVRRFRPLPGFHILSFSAPAPPQMGNPFYMLISPEPFSTESQQRRGGLFPQSYVLIADEGLCECSHRINQLQPSRPVRAQQHVDTCTHTHPTLLWSEHHGA